MTQESSVPEFVITNSREFWEQKTYEEIKKHTYLDPLYDAAFKAFLNNQQRTLQMKNAPGAKHPVTKSRLRSPSGSAIFH